MIIAIDCDLRESYCVTDGGAAGRGRTVKDALCALPADLDVGPGCTYLFEIASPVSFNRGASGHAAMTQLAKWAIWNTAQAAFLDMLCRKMPQVGTVLVAPSNVWTHGYDLKTRHAIAKCKQPKKDLRECEAMIWFYQQRPQDWKPLPDYLAAL